MAIKETVKKLFGKVLAIGTPPEKEVLYKEVIKRKVPVESPEKLMISDIKNSVKKLFTHKEKDVESSRGTVNPPVKKAPKKKTTAKTSTTTKKATSKTSTVKKPATKKTTTTKKKNEITPKTKTATSKTTSTKKSTDKKVTKTKTTTAKTSASKSPIVKAEKTLKKKPVEKKKVEPKAATKAPAKKSTATQKLSKRDQKIALYIKDIKKHYGEVDEDFVTIIVKNLGPSIYRKDAELVSCSDPKELDTVRRNFLVKKLGIDASKGVLDAAIEDVCLELKGVRTKYRATFYYALAKKFKKESVLS